MAEKTVVVLGANSFSGQDFVDLLLDRPGYRVIGVSLPVGLLRVKLSAAVSTILSSVFDPCALNP